MSLSRLPHDFLLGIGHFIAVCLVTGLDHRNRFLFMNISFFLSPLPFDFWVVMTTISATSSNFESLWLQRVLEQHYFLPYANFISVFLLAANLLSRPFFKCLIILIFICIFVRLGSHAFSTGHCLHMTKYIPNVYIVVTWESRVLFFSRISDRVFASSLRCFLSPGGCYTLPFIWLLFCFQFLRTCLDYSSYHYTTFQLHKYWNLSSFWPPNSLPFVIEFRKTKLFLISIYLHNGVYDAALKACLSTVKIFMLLLYTTRN